MSKKQIIDGDAAQRMIKDFARTMALQNPVLRDRYNFAIKSGYSAAFAAIYAQQEGGK